MVTDCENFLHAVPASAGSAFIAFEQLREAQNCIHWNGQLVAHVGEEFRFGCVGAFGFLLGCHALGLC